MLKTHNGNAQFSIVSGVSTMTGNLQKEMSLSCDEVLNNSVDNEEAKDSAEAEYSVLLIECLRVLIEGEGIDCVYGEISIIT